jgi:hypothetical protein
VQRADTCFVEDPRLFGDLADVLFGRIPPHPHGDDEILVGTSRFEVIDQVFGVLRLDAQSVVPVLAQSPFNGPLAGSANPDGYRMGRHGQNPDLFE